MISEQGNVQDVIEKRPIKVSIIIPSYNSASTIAETIHSVQNQTFNGWEVIVVDDGSTDETRSIINNLVGKDSRISIITQSNQGVCSARNTGITRAQFDWLLFLDSDDWIADNYLERMTNVLNAHSEIDGVHCGWTRVTPAGELVREMYGSALHDLFPVLAMHCPFAIHACIIRKSLVETAGGFDTSLKTCEDWDLWLKIARIGARFELVKEVMAFYRMRRHSLSSNATRFFRDAMRVLTQAHFPDDRLKGVNLLYPNGESPELLPVSKFYITIWIAGYLMGEGQDAKHLLSALTSEKAPSLEPYWVADSIFDAAIVPNCQTLSQWNLLYPQFEPAIDEFLSALEIQSECLGLAKRSKLNLVKMILQGTQISGAFSIGPYYTTFIEITEPIEDIYVENKGLERLYCVLRMEGQLLGTIELPICDGVVSAYVLKDATANQYHWPILGRFFENTVYCKSYPQNTNESKSFEEIHNTIGWTTFMQQLWNRPDWDINKFYDSGVKETSIKQVNEADVEVVEISQELPDILTTTENHHLIFSVGGVNAGIISIPVKDNLIRASEIRVAINVNSGLELCRVCVREALIGKTLKDPTPLVQRLRHAFNANKSQTVSTQNNIFSITDNKLITANSMLLGRRAGQMNLSISRRAALPSATAAPISEMAKAFNEPVIQLPANLNQADYVMYAPEFVAQLQDAQWSNALENEVKEVNVYGRQHFETLFSKQKDPWKYTHPYEQTKYEFTLSLLPRQKIDKALEIACAEGHFTEQLAPLVNNLTAADISKVALERTAHRCERFEHISYQNLDLVKDNLPGQFELIVCSEVLYYVGDLNKLRSVAKKIANALLPKGYLVMAHAHQVIDEPKKPGFDWGLSFGAKVIGETFAKIHSLRLVKEIRTPLYRVQLFQKTKPNIFSLLPINKPSIQFLDQPTPIPEDVMDSVRWNGGIPSGTTVISKLSTEKLPILMYHRVAPHGSQEMSRYRVSPGDFEEHLKFLKESGYYSVTLEDWTTAVTMKRPLPGLAVIFTFDDGYKDFYEYAWPLLKKYGFTATVFLVSGQVGQQNAWDEVYGEKLPLMGWEEIIELQQQGVEFGSHAATHQPLTSLTPTQIVEEGIRSRTSLQNELQRPVQLIAYPYGDTDTVVAHLLGACGYTIGVTTENRLSSFNDDPMRLPRIEVEGHFKLEEFIAKLS
ncbi:glycosyltransferase [Chitinophagaceae bacterium LB-8]|uniref:Glycosyltransferase n=1 Tax=Paraflavisolibacter caeni TaxID=2982496 RepID=A0A9X2XWH5_9BACT|nr:trifunctional glycosyltransferase/class I SAM-dependent methyltransferase/polysaccharide deacetylase [Paraflavisolibacter caeni]MCU7550526.1 glycosyltransferase [Paraflavisolibacter caeni]